MLKLKFKPIRGRWRFAILVAHSKSQRQMGKHLAQSFAILREVVVVVALNFIKSDAAAEVGGELNKIKKIKII